MSEDNERPFVEDGSQFGISESAFAELPPAQQRELMVQWFFENFEDPVNDTPWDNEDKEYIFLWGGPFEANDQIGEKFGDLVPYELIKEVVEQIESDGTSEWAPRSNSPFYDDGRDDEEPEPPEPPSLDVYLDEKSDRYGSNEEREARAEALNAIENLRATLQARRPIGIGHNQPLDETEQPEGIADLPQALQELSSELQQPDPEIGLVKRWAAPLRNALIASAKWTFKKIDGAITAVTNAGAVGGTYWLVSNPEHIKTAFDMVVKWLEIAAKTLF